MLFPDFKELVELGRLAPRGTLSARRKSVSNLTGDYKSPFRGRGLEFEEVREYVAGADDVQSADGESLVLCDYASFEAVKKALTDASLPVLSADVVMRPDNRVAVADEDARETLLDLIDWLEGLDDVQEVYHNAAL